MQGSHLPQFLLVTAALLPAGLAKAQTSPPVSGPPSPPAEVSAVPPAANPNVLPEEALAPKQLLDAGELASYLAAFPANEYRVAEVPGLGRFYLDDIYDYIKNELRSGKPWDPHLLPVLQKHIKPGSTVLDVGAHIGTMSIPMSRWVGPEGRVYSFEPQKKIYRELVKNLEINRITNVVPLRFAAGDRSAIIEMGRSPKRNEGHTSIGHGGDRAELRTLDSFGFRNLSLVKIDVESHENEVIDGARETLLAQHPVVLLEIMGGFDHDKAGAKLRKQIDTTIAKLEELGYEVSRIQSWDYLALPRK